MERRQFLAAAASATASLAAAVTAAAAASTPMPYETPIPGYSSNPAVTPQPGASGFPGTGHLHRRWTGGGATGGQTDLAHIHRHLERLIGMLEQYQGNGGHVSQAVSYLQQADTEIVAQLSMATPPPTL